MECSWNVIIIIIVKPEKEQAAKEIFSETAINITTEGR